MKKYIIYNCDERPKEAIKQTVVICFVSFLFIMKNLILANSE